MLSKEEVEKAKGRIEDILNCYDEYKKDYEEGHQSSFELDLEDFEVLQTLLFVLGITILIVLIAIIIALVITSDSIFSKIILGIIMIIITIILIRSGLKIGVDWNRIF